MKAIITAIGMIILGFLTTLLLTKVVVSIANLYEINQIINLGFVKTYVLLSIFSVVNFNYKEEMKDNKEYNEKNKRVLIMLVGKSITYLLFWGLMILAHNVLI